MALSIGESATKGADHDTSIQPPPFTKAELDRLMSPYDLKRLESYANNMLDYHVILDLVPRIAMVYFTGPLKASVKLTGVQEAILLAIGLQCKEFSTIELEPELSSVQASQLLAMFIKIMRKMSAHFGSLISGAHEADLPARETIGVSRADASGAHDDEIIDERFVALETGLEEELEEGGDEALKALREKQRELIDALPLDQ
jgi:N-acetyltransferase 10